MKVYVGIDNDGNILKSYPFREGKEPPEAGLYLVDAPEDFNEKMPQEFIIDTVNKTAVFSEIKHNKILDHNLLEEELTEIKKWFASTDYIPNKIITGEWQTTDQRWIDYLSERSIKRARQDEILESLGDFI